MISKRPFFYEIIVLSLSLTFLAPVRLDAQQPHDPPAIKVFFDVGSAPLYQNLPQKEQLEEAIATYLAERFRQVKPFSFVRWIPSSDVNVPDAEVKGILRVHVKEIPVVIGSVEASRVVVSLSHIINGSTSTDLDINTVLYDITELDRHKQNPERLKQRIQNRLDEWFNTAGAESFERDLMDNFLKHVPLSEAVQLDETNFLLIVPLRAEAYDLSSKDAVLRATFDAEDNSGTPYKGWFRMEVEGPFVSSGWTDEGLYCMLTFFWSPRSFHQPPPLKLEEPTPQVLRDTYGRDIKEIFNSVRSVSVFMERYPFSGTALADHL